MRKFFIVLCSLLMGIALGWLLSPYVCDVCGIDEVKTDTVVKMDTVFCNVPVVKDSVTVKYITRWLKTSPSPSKGGEIGSTSPETFPETSEGGEERDGYLGVVSTSAGGLPGSCSLVTIPIEQKIYAGYEYTAWVSGYEAELDSIQIYNRTEVVTNTTYIDKKRGRWGVMIGAGAGIDHKGLCAPMVGVMVGYKIF